MYATFEGSFELHFGFTRPFFKLDITNIQSTTNNMYLVPKVVKCHLLFIYIN